MTTSHIPEIIRENVVMRYFLSRLTCAYNRENASGFKTQKIHHAHLKCGRSGANKGRLVTDFKHIRISTLFGINR